MTLETSLASIIIRNNIIDQGRVSDGATPVTYTYAYHAWILGSSLISGNTFAAPTASTDMLYIDNCSCTITGNKFIRGSTSIGSYIRNAGNDQTIVNNTFDSSTIDGSSETLVAGTLTTSNYYGNKNQTIYISVPMAPQATRNTGVAGSVMDFVGETNYAAIANAQALTIVNGKATYGETETNFMINPYLPEGVRILSFKFGAHRGNSGAPALNGAATNSFSLKLKSIDTVTANYATGTSSIMDTFNTLNNTLDTTTVSQDLNASSFFSTTMLTTQYYSIDVSANSYYINNKSYAIIAQFAVGFLLSSGTATLYFSPTVIRCRW